jgi:hypothetical protein
MNQHQKLQNLIDFIEEELNAKINFFPWDHIPDPECRWDLPIDGCVYLDEEIPPEIDIYVNDMNRDVDLVITCLIHEMGHILCFNEVGNEHTELDAWEAAVLSLPQEYIPDCFESIKETALQWYDEIGREESEVRWNLDRFKQLVSLCFA